MSRPPPPRYRVIEEGRRLVVIDNWAESGRPASVTRAPPADTPGALGAVQQTGFDGRGIITTSPFYDDKGPRTIRLDPGSASLTKLARWTVVGIAMAVLVAIIVSPWLLIPLGFVVVQGFKKIRAGITRWLDTVEREAG